MGVTLEAWLAALQALLPPGRALTRDPASVLTRVLSAIGAMFLSAQLKLEALLVEMDPRRAIAMLPDWERLLGLPDKCTPTAGLSTQDRQRLAYQRLIEQGGQSRAYFLGLAEQLGEPQSWIEEFRQANCNSNCNSALYSQADEFAWRLNFRRAVTNPRIANCNDNCNSALRWAKPSLAECPIRERKPAHTNVLFAYAVRVYQPSDLQPFHTRASTAWAFDAAGVLQQYAANELRIGMSPAGVTSALREPESTNYLRNNTMVGASVGANALPNFWGTSLGGLATQIVGVPVVDGIECIDVRLYGVTTATSAGIRFEANTQIAAAAGQTWDGSAYLAIVGGSTANLSGVKMNVTGHQGAGASTADSQYGPDLRGGLTASLARFDQAIALADVATQYVRSQLWMSFAVGAAIDITLRIGLPQLEKQPFATTPIKTSGAAVTRARDEIVLPLDLPAGASFGAFVDCVLARSGVATATLVGAESAAANQRLLGVDANVHSFNNAVQLSLATGFVNGVRATAIYAQDATGRGISASGSDAVSDGAVAQPISRLLLGQRAQGADTDAAAVMYVHEFRTYRYRPTNAELKTATA